jgi:hypothetical protein
MKKQELINRLEMLDIVAEQVSKEVFPDDTGQVCNSPISIMYRMRDRIRELEIENEGIQTAQAAMEAGLKSTRKRMSKMQQFVEFIASHNPSKTRDNKS